jgi:thiol-disulfide isomerase/thioredoxin
MVISITLAGDSCFAQSKSPSENGTEISPAQTGGEEVKKPAAKPFTMVLFWGEGCSYCADEKAFLSKVASRFPAMTIIDYEVRNDQQNRWLMGRVAEAYGLKFDGVPVTFIDKKGYTGSSPSIKKTLLSEIERCSVEGCVNPFDVMLSAKGK